MMTTKSETTIKFVLHQTSLNGEPYRRRIKEFATRGEAVAEKQRLLADDDRDSYVVKREEYLRDTHVSTTNVG